MTIARRFNAENRSDVTQVPKGTAESQSFSVVPPGFGSLCFRPGSELPGHFQWFFRNRPAIGPRPKLMHATTRFSSLKSVSEH